MFASSKYPTHGSLWWEAADVCCSGNPTCTAGFLVIGDFGDFGGSAPGDFRVLRRVNPHEIRSTVLNQTWGLLDVPGGFVRINGL